MPGSQNGYDNSGKAGPINWAKKREYYTQTQYAYNRLVDYFTQPEWIGTVTAIEAINEVSGVRVGARCHAHAAAQPAANRDSGVRKLLNECE